MGELVLVVGLLLLFTGAIGTYLGSLSLLVAVPMGVIALVFILVGVNMSSEPSDDERY